VVELAVEDLCQEWESRERGSSPGESQIALGAWENTRKTKVVAIPRSSELWSAQAAQWHKGVLTNDKRARELHELAQYLRKIPIKYWPMGK